ncbi:MAG: aminotransferase class I/II-fold pyridoxal phosphate-dependent enzyme [Methyloprofundus sp.]|nr:aminotransferase class I/II-fold pyridoxal phosphate-dependent enzyme [Methyloprofundus sp.]
MLTKLLPVLSKHVQALSDAGTTKGDEAIISGFQKPENGFGLRVLLEGYSGRPFLRMNSNAYLGLSSHPQVIAAETEAAEKYGAGPSAVRFIGGTYQPHIELEHNLAKFHGRNAAMLFSSAYAAVIGTLPALINEETLVISDALNHNCIINAIRLSKAGGKAVYSHLDLSGLEAILIKHKGQFKRVCVISDGVFSMRGDHAPLNEMLMCCKKHEADYEQGIITMIDDSHGVGAFGTTGRGTEEVTAARADILIATLGKAFAVNGGYVVAEQGVIDYLKETAASYIYSNPMTPAEAAAANVAINIATSAEGRTLLQSIKALAKQLRLGLKQAGYETLPGEHPIVPILIRDTQKTKSLVQHLFEHNILATGLNYPVVAKGEQEIRLQVSACHTSKDIEYFLHVLAMFNK